MRPDEVLRHLERRLSGFQPRCAPQPLTGGLLNEIWRVAGAHRSVVVKHAEDHIATDPSIPLDAGRIAFEARALGDLAPGGRLADVPSTAARPPRALDFDAERSVLVMEDLGDAPDLVARLSSGDDPASLGETLGAFIARLHESSLDDRDLARDYRNAAIQETRLELQYRPIALWLESLGVDDASSCGARALELGERLLEPGMCLVMGDLWPPSILVTSEGLRLIDWEFTHFGSPIQDLAHLAAHLEMHALTGAGEAPRAAWRHVAKAYRARGGRVAARLATPKLQRDLETHFAAEILVRTVGPFARDFLFSGCRPGEGPRREAVAVAVAHLRSDAASSPLDALR